MYAYLQQKLKDRAAVETTATNSTATTTAVAQPSPSYYVALPSVALPAAANKNDPISQNIPVMSIQTNKEIASSSSSSSTAMDTSSPISQARSSTNSNSTPSEPEPQPMNVEELKHAIEVEEKIVEIEEKESSSRNNNAHVGERHILSRDHVIFNLQILGSQGIVICPGFQRLPIDDEDVDQSPKSISSVSSPETKSRSNSEEDVYNSSKRRSQSTEKTIPNPSDVTVSSRESEFKLDSFAAISSQSDIESNISPTLLPPSQYPYGFGTVSLSSSTSTSASTANAFLNTQSQSSTTSSSGTSSSSAISIASPNSAATSIDIAATASTTQPTEPPKSVIGSFTVTFRNGVITTTPDKTAFNDQVLPVALPARTTTAAIANSASALSTSLSTLYTEKASHLLKRMPSWLQSVKNKGDNPSLAPSSPVKISTPLTFQSDSPSTFPPLPAEIGEIIDSSTYQMPGSHSMDISDQQDPNTSPNWLSQQQERISSDPSTASDISSASTASSSSTSSNNATSETSNTTHAVLASSSDKSQQSSTQLTSPMTTDDHKGDDTPSDVAPTSASDSTAQMHRRSSSLREEVGKSVKSVWNKVSRWLFPHEQVIISESDSSSVPSSPKKVPFYSTVKKIVIVGVHGWSLFGGFLGEKPLHISTKFCFFTQKAVQKYLTEHNVNMEQIDICCIPLFGHGSVNARVEMYLTLQLPEYKNKLREADLILFVGHSQGCIVSAKLISSMLSAPANTSLLFCPPPAMAVLLLAGLHHGPFPDLYGDGYQATKELFTYAQYESHHSQSHREALSICLERGVKILCVGSVHDQVVPLYSSLAHLLPSSPNLLRAFYVDYTHYQPDFLYALISLYVYILNTRHQTKLPGNQNINGSRLSDSYWRYMYSCLDLLVHLSGFVRGSLLDKNGGAHSAIHRLEQAYELTVEWAFAGRSVPSPELASDLPPTVSPSDKLYTQSFAVWSGQINDAFTFTKFNRHLLLLKTREVLELLPYTALNTEEELSRLSKLYTVWQPRSKELKILKDTLSPLFIASIPSNL